jgi:hypothetical protein
MLVVTVNQIPETCKSQQIWKLPAIQKRILQISTDLKVVRELSIVENQSYTTSPIHERRQIQTPQQQLITSLPPPPHLQTPDAINHHTSP